jgi:hypothetical protein
MNSGFGQSIAYHFGLDLLVDCGCPCEHNKATRQQIFGCEVGGQERRVETGLTHYPDLFEVVLVFDAASSPAACGHQNSIEPDLQFIDCFDDKVVVLFGG